MKMRTVAALALGPSGNLQGGVRCYSLRTGKVLHRFMKDITLMKMPHNVLGRLKYITRKEKSIKGLIFGDRYNNDIPDDVITGVLVPNAATTDNDDHVNAPYELIDDESAIEADDTEGLEVEELDSYEVKQETKQEENDDSLAEDNADKEEDATTTGVTPENAADEIQPPESEYDSDSDESEEEIYNTGATTRYGRVSEPYDYVKKFPLIYGDTNFSVDTNEDMRCLRVYYQDENLNRHLNTGFTCKFLHQEYH